MDLIITLVSTACEITHVCVMSRWLCVWLLRCCLRGVSNMRTVHNPKKLRTCFCSQWTEHTQSIHAGLTEFGELRRVGIEDLQRLGTFRLDLLQECAEWHAVFHDIHCSGARPADISTADSVLA